METSELAAALLDIERRAVEGAPPVEEESKWTDLVKRLIRRLQQESGERRKCLRIPLDVAEATLGLGQARATVEATDLSNGGISLRGIEDASVLQPGEEIELQSIRFQGEDFPQRLPCRVAWVEPHKDGRDGQAIGLAFVDVNKERRDLFFPCYYKSYSGFLTQLAGR